MIGGAEIGDPGTGVGWWVSIRLSACGFGRLSAGPAVVVRGSPVLVGGRRYYPAMVPRYAHDDVDLRRRCVAHDQWIADHPDLVSFVETWADQNLEMIGGL